MKETRPCKLCGELTPRVYCCEKHRQSYYHKVVIQENTCTNCGCKFGVTTNQRLRQYCRAPECRRVSTQRGAAAKAAAAKQAATRPPQHIRATYCVRQEYGPPVRCKHHLEPSCRYRVEDGRPVCRVEPASVAVQSHYRSSLAGAVSMLAMVQR